MREIGAKVSKGLGTNLVERMGAKMVRLGQGILGLPLQ